MVERKVIKSFTDKESKNAFYRGSKFKGKEKRVNELVKAGYLEKVEATVKKEVVETADQLKSIGGGYYELPNGEKVQGKENALKALAETGE